MISVGELLGSIPGEDPSGQDLRYEKLYDEIREARRHEEELPQGVWQHERKVADYPLVVQLATGALREKTKDLQIAGWLADAALRAEGFAAFRQSLILCLGLMENYWETVFPKIENGDVELRVVPLDWIGSKLEDPVRKAPLTEEGYGWYEYVDSRKLGYDDQIKDANQKKAREKLIASGKLAPEIFDKAFLRTPKGFYAALERDLDGSLKELSQLDEFCDAHFGESAPSFGKLKAAIEDVRQVAHGLLQEKRKTEPDPPVEETPKREDEVGAKADPSPSTEGLKAASPLEPSLRFTVLGSSESAGRRELVESIAAAAAILRKREPLNPASYLVMRGLRWGDLRNAAALSDPEMLEAPPTEIRQRIKRLALQERWLDLLDASEAVMALPCSRAWLDLQRFVIEACTALGSAYLPIAIAIRSELRALLQDVPHLVNATLNDDTPAANLETRQWLRSLLAEPPGGNGAIPSQAEPSPEDENPVRWQRRFLDSFVLAKEALRTGQVDQALEIMQNEIARQRSARGRFQRRLQFVDLCVSAGKDQIAQPILDDLIAAIDAHKLEDWEDRATMAAALVTVMHASKKIQADAKEKQKFFERVCRLDPVQALNC